MLRACGHEDENQECNTIKSQAELYDLEVHDYCPKTNHELNQILNRGVTYVLTPY